MSDTEASGGGGAAADSVRVRGDCPIRRVLRSHRYLLCIVARICFVFVMCRGNVEARDAAAEVQDSEAMQGVQEEAQEGREEARTKRWRVEVEEGGMSVKTRSDTRHE